jgi:hypothetical protein
LPVSSPTSPRCPGRSPFLQASESGPSPGECMLCHTCKHCTKLLLVHGLDDNLIIISLSTCLIPSFIWWPHCRRADAAEKNKIQVHLNSTEKPSQKSSVYFPYLSR